VLRVSHARAFATMTALVILSILMISLGTYPFIWVLSRALYGFAATGLFIISQSWLNHACVNEWRGKIIGLFYMVYVIAIGSGGLLLRYVSLDGATVPLIGIFFATVALLPVCLTRLQTPPPPASIAIAVRSVWRISPVGLVGLFAVGGLTMLLQGFGPIYVANQGYSKNDVGLLIFLMQLGLIVVQYPLGALSDRMDRRILLICASLLTIVAASFAIGTSAERFVLIVLIFAIWSGATESIFSIANAHANDRADPEYYVSLSSTLLVGWSLSGLVVPAITTFLTPAFGPKVFMYIAIVIAALYGVFVTYRMFQRDPTPADETEPHQQVSAQMPLSTELAHPPEDIP